jgi:hypothetical protein
MRGIGAIVMFIGAGVPIALAQSGALRVPKVPPRVIERSGVPLAASANINLVRLTS